VQEDCRLRKRIPFFFPRTLERRALEKTVKISDVKDRAFRQKGIAYANTVAEAMNLNLDMDNPADREKLRRVILDLVAGKKMPKQKRHRRNSLVLFLASTL
jgi:hypothetical protein